MNAKFNYYKDLFQENEDLKILAKHIFIDHNLINEIPAITLKYGSPLLLVDDNTCKLLPLHIDGMKLHIFPHNVRPDIQLLNQISTLCIDCDVIVGFGSGTINDICKYSAFKFDKPYIIFPSAMSMNGYTSCFASMFDGNMHKKSYLAKLPEAIFVDLDIITNAPIRMTLSGLYDFLCRSFVRTDLILSHFLIGTEFNEEQFLATSALESNLVENFHGLVNKDPEIIKLLIHALMISGMWMSYTCSSKSASQGEHMLAHVFEHFSDNQMLHGELVGIAMLITGNYQEIFLSNRPMILPNAHIVENAESFFIRNWVLGDFYGASKVINAEKANQMNEILHSKWDLICNTINADRISYPAVRSIIEQHGCLSTNRLSIQPEILSDITKYSFITRERFTILDLVLML